MLQVLDGDQGAREVRTGEAHELLAQIIVPGVVGGQLEALRAGLRVQALAQRQRTVGDQPEVGGVRIDGQRLAQVLVELKGMYIC